MIAGISIWNGGTGSVSEGYIIGKEALRGMDDSTLFYPCSGNDLEVPVRLFSPHVTDFWFVDRGYFTPGHQDTKGYGLDRPADEVEPILGKNADYQLLRADIEGMPHWNLHNRDIEPCILTETYRHLPSGKTIKVRRRRGYGFSAFRNDIRQIGVFFYRGDSGGEGGSGNLWLKPDHIDEICAKLINGGLLVTDGSQQSARTKSSPKAEYYPLAQYHGTRPRPKDPDEIVRTTKPFTDSKGRTFTCVGYAGERYGPTLIWQVKGLSK